MLIAWHIRELTEQIRRATLAAAAAAAEPQTAQSTATAAIPAETLIAQLERLGYRITRPQAA
jgi:hypothetical protein